MEKDSKRPAKERKRPSNKKKPSPRPRKSVVSREVEATEEIPFEEHMEREEQALAEEREQKKAARKPERPEGPKGAEAKRGDGPGKGDDSRKSDPRRSPRPAKGNGYTVQVFFDSDEQQFVASVLEIPQLMEKADTVEDAVESVSESLKQKLGNGGKDLPEPINGKKYPERLDLPLSQGLFRRLDRLSRTERVPLEALVVELLSEGVANRNAIKSVAAKQPNQQPHRQQNQRNQNNRQGNRQDNQRHGNQRNGNSGNNQNRRSQQGGNRFHNTMESHGNFLEYVRSLEKGYKKR